MVPVKVSDDVLVRCAPHRARGRLPALSWLHPESRASLTRAAQPLAGPSARRNEADEELVRSIRDANANTVNLLVFDVRPQVLLTKALSIDIDRSFTFRTRYLPF